MQEFSYFSWPALLGQELPALIFTFHISSKIQFILLPQYTSLYHPVLKVNVNQTYKVKIHADIPH